MDGYKVAAFDGEIGRIEDFIVDDDSWVVRYVVVDVGTALSGPNRRVLLAPSWLTSLAWTRKEAHTALTVEEIEESPEHDPTAPVDRAYEERLYDHYGRRVYWDKWNGPPPVEGQLRRAVRDRTRSRGRPLIANERSELTVRLGSGSTGLGSPIGGGRPRPHCRRRHARSRFSRGLRARSGRPYSAPPCERFAPGLARSR